MYDLPYQISGDIMVDQWGANEVRATRPARVLAVAKAAILLENSLPGDGFRNTVWPGCDTAAILRHQAS
jgi:hypothetical protein